jgi:hypothetical protein
VDLALEVVLLVVGVTVYLILKIEGLLNAYADKVVARDEAKRRADAARARRDAPARTALCIDGAQALAPNQHRILARFGLRPERARELLLFTSDRPLERLAGPGHACAAAALRRRPRAWTGRGGRAVRRTQARAGARRVTLPSSRPTAARRRACSRS